MNINYTVCLMFKTRALPGKFLALSQSISLIYKTKSFYRRKNL